MRENIHPHYTDKHFICSCGNKVIVGTTYSKTEELHVNICAKCHPFFTGKNKIVDTAGRVERFNKKYNISSKA
jgi:large subunit ribosomal protein L31